MASWMVHQLLFLAFIGVCHAQVCSSDLDCDPPLVCSGPPLKLTACVEPSEKKLFFSELDRIVVPARRLGPGSSKCYRDIDCGLKKRCLKRNPTSQAGTCVPQDGMELIRQPCVTTATCPPNHHCFKKPGKRHGSCHPNTSQHQFISSIRSVDLMEKCQSDADCKQPEENCKALPPRSSNKFCIPRSRRLSDAPKLRHSFPPLFCENDRQCPINCRCDSTHTCECFGRSLIPLITSDKCKYDAECPSGMTCKRDNQGPFNVGTCIASRRFTGCTSDAQCTDRQFCSFQLHICLEKTHSSPSKALMTISKFWGCSSDAQCADGEQCRQLNGHGVCLPSNGRFLTPPGDCPTVQCPRGFECRNGLCRQMYPSFTDNFY